MNWELTSLTWWCLGIITAVFIGSLVYIEYLRRNDLLISYRRSVEYLPTLVSTLGVLGTFLGITLGLLKFNPQNLPISIPQLLDGLKTAFFTSLAGMIGSVILSGYLNKSQDKKDGGVSDINQAAGSICQAVQTMSQLNAEAIGTLKQQLAEQEVERRAFYRTMGDMMEDIRKYQSATASTLDSLVILERSQEGALVSIKKSSDNVADNTHHVGEILDIVAGMSSTQDRINDQVQKLKAILDAEVDQIEQSMDKTNNLLERKFDEFTELLKKSNTEALVEVMKTVTEEFQKQMNSLINKLIQENFEQLNQSVERLNKWQQENKEMITSLTIQYKEMADNFEATSTSLIQVKDDTQALVSEGGKLRQIVNALNEVIVQDEKFIQTAEHLQKTAELSHSNMEAFDESTNALNEWVRKQRNFVDGVMLLIEKLEEIGKIKDYNEQFWKGTRQQMEEGVSIISRGTQTLNTQLTTLDKSFYNRLGATLAELDNCITKMVEQVGKC
ncbi:MAG: hypothetical protein HDR45_07085 [Bacteroides sp.]|nr:hypothetical protein [Bacteroides sp.]MBD5425937.1 hypothetical protein [Bacteroides sp.]